MTAGQELLAPKPSKLKSSLFPKAPRPKLEIQALESPPSAALSSTEEDITPIVSNVKKQKPLAPSGRPPTHALSVEVNKKRPLNPSQWSPRVLSPKGKTSQCWPYILVTHKYKSKAENVVNPYTCTSMSQLHAQELPNRPTTPGRLISPTTPRFSSRPDRQ